MDIASINDPLYYWRNARLLIEWVAQRYLPIMDEQARLWLEHWQALPDSEQAMLVRVLSRKGKLFRSDKLAYDEIGPFSWHTSQLQAFGLVQVDPKLAVQDIAKFATVADLQQHVAKGKKADMVEQFTARFSRNTGHSNGQTRWSDHFSSSILIQLNCRDAFDQIRMLFFGNLQQTLSDFIFAELGVQARLPIDTGKLSNAFTTGQHIQDALRTHELGEAIELGELSLHWLEQIPQSPNWLKQRYLRRLFRLGHQFERSADVEAAIQCYQASMVPDAKIRLLRVLERQQLHHEAQLLCQQMLSEPDSEQVFDAARKVAKRLIKLGIDLPAVIAPARPNTQHLKLMQRPKHLEIGVAEALGEHVFFVENSLWQALFFLTFAKAIVAPVNGAYFHPFQRWPADLYDADFRQKRASEMHSAWALLESNNYADKLAQTLESELGQALMANLAPINHELLLNIAARLPASLLKAVFERMWFDLKHNKTGFPDLVQLIPVFKLYEVKGPGDSLQPHQTAWLNFFNQKGVAATVLTVEFEQS